MIDMTIGPTTKETIIDKTMVTKGIGIEVPVENIIGPGPHIEAIQGIIQETDIIETKAEIEIEDKGLGLFQEIGKIDQGLDQAPVLALIRIGPGAIDAMNMTTLLWNALMPCLMKVLIKKMIVLLCNC